MKDYKSMFQGREGTIIGLCDEGMLIFDGFFIDGDMRAKYIVPVFINDLNSYLNPDQVDVESWIEDVSDGYTLLGFYDWWKGRIEAASRTCFEHPYPDKDESGCDVLFNNPEIRKEVEDAIKERWNTLPVTWEYGGVDSPEFFSECYLINDEEISREFNLRREEIKASKDC